MKKKLFCLFMVLVFMSSTALVSASSYFKVVGDSMNPVLKDGDTIQVVSYTYKDGDMVVAQLQNGKKIVKRLMGDRLVSVGQGTNYPVSEVTILGAAEYVPMSMEELELYGFSWESVLAEGERIVQVVAGWNHSLVLTNAGAIYTWGSGGNGELGNGTTEEKQTTPVKVSDGEMGNSNVTAIAGGGAYSLALKGGIVYAWGLEIYGRLGNGTTTAKQTTPVKVSDGEMGNSNVTAISSGIGHSLALKDGKVYAWGWGQNGRLGNGETVNKTTPVKVSDGEMGNSDVTAISAGEYSLALKDGKVYAWGGGDSGQLGNGETADKTAPVKVSDGEMGNSSVATISTYYKHSLALKDGTVYTWGSGEFGKLGNGETANKTTPVKVSDGEMGNVGISGISTGYNHSVALKDGKVYAWGLGDFGRLGNGETTNKTTPVIVLDGEMGNSGVTAISAGNCHSLALKGGEPYSWGRGDSGQLGNRQIASKTTPVKVSLHPDWLKIVAITAIPGVIAPVSGAAPVTTAINTDQYTGTVSWSPNHNPFKGSIAYTATITLTAKEGYTLTGVAADTFSVAGATATHAADSGTVTAVFPATAASAGSRWGDNITESINGDVLTLSGSGPIYDFTMSSSPDINASGVKEIIIGDGITRIGNYAFSSNYGTLTSITIPSSVTSIGEGAVMNGSLTSLTIPNSVISIGDSSFRYNKLASITIPSSVTSIGDYAFSDNSLTTLSIPASVTNIGTEVFRKNKLTSLIIPSSVTSIGSYAFAFNELQSIEIPDSVTNIGGGAFYGNKLASITIPGSVKNIGADAFTKNSLTSITIPSSVTNVGYAAFSENNLTSITMASAGVIIGNNLLEYYNDFFRTAYTSGGAGTYTGTQTGTWSKAVPIDTSRYDELVHSVNNLTEGDYTPQSFADYKTAIASVNLTLTNANTQEEINAEVNKIQNALALLVLRPLEPAPKPDFSIEPLEPPQVGKILLTVSTLTDSTIYYKKVDEFKSRDLGESFNPDGWTVYTAPTIVSADNGMLFEVVIVDAMGKVLQSGGFELNDGTVTAFDFSIEIPQKILVGNTINFGVNVTPSTGKYNGFDFKSSNPDVATLLWTGMPGLQIKAVAPGTVNFILTATDAGRFERVISVEVVDRSGLVDAINYFAGIKTQESKYTPETFGVLYDLDWYIRQAYYQYPDLTFAEYEDLLLRFNAAKNGLVLINVVDTQAVAAAKAAIVDGTVNVAYGADQTAKTAAVQTYVNTLLTGEAAGVTAIVTYVSANNYSVAISKGEANDTKTITMTINEEADPDTTAVNDAKTAAENENYSDMNQGTATDEEAIENAIKAEAEAAVNDNSITVTINKLSYTAPIAGTSANPGGTNGSYVFAITVSKGGQIQTTAQKTITITATAYSPTPTYIVSGNVKDSNHVEVSNAVVKLMSGKTQIGSTVQTNESGEFIITGVPNGTYNLVVQKGDIIVTTLITVSGGNYASGAITLPNGKTNSIVEVKSDNLSIVVGGLDAQFTASASIEDNKGITDEDKNVVASGGTVEIKFTAEKKAENAAPNASNITISAKADGKTVSTFFDLSVVKTVTTSGGSPSTTTTTLVELPNLIEVFIPLEEANQGKNGYVIYRYHGSSVDMITTAPNADGEKIDLVDNGKTLKLKVNKFSTYAISYATPVVPPNDNNNNSNNTGSGKVENKSGNDSVTIKNTEGGTIKESPDSTNTEKIFDITPNAGYVIADILVDGKSAGAAKKYVIKDLTKKVEIQAIFVKATAIPYYIDITGKEIFIKYSAVIDGVMKYIAPQGVTVLFKDNVKNFKDISGHGAMQEIDFVTERELFVGTAPNVFSPDRSMTRAMFVSVLGRLYEASFGAIKESTSNPFTDTVHDSWYIKYVKWAYENGIISGVGGGKFEPGRAITMEEMAVVLDKYLKFTKFATPAKQQYITFEDEENIAEWAKASVQSMQKLGIIGGMENNTFNPKGIATRAQAATVIYKMINSVLKN